MRDDRQAIESVRLAGDRAAFLRVNQALRIAAIRGFGFALLAMKRALPSKSICEESHVLLAIESLDRVVVQSKRSRGITAPFGVAGAINKLPRASRISLRHAAARLGIHS